ncbi:MAG: SDR family oxidoreductase [Acidobacteria bacterium]|nr:SDR family oxidoreductase [Acidobacteriota bacterium]
MNLKEKYGPWAVITGASAGIGEQFALQLAALKFNLVLVARRIERLQKLSDELSKTHGIECKVVPLDLSKEEAADELKGATSSLDVGLLINNAGMGYYGLVVNQEPRRYPTMIRLNCTTVALLAHHFAKRFVARGRGGMVIVASTAAFQGTPHMSLYGATKGFDLLLAEAMAQELKGTGVDILALCPGATATEFQGSAGGAAHTGADPARVAKDALCALGRKPVVISGFANKIQVVSERLFPRKLVVALGERVLRRLE